MLPKSVSLLLLTQAADGQVVAVVLDDTEWPLPSARSGNASPAPLALIALTRADPAHDQCGDASVACPFPSCKQRYTDVKALRM